MAAVFGEELLATEAAAGAEAGAAEGSAGQFQYSGGGVGGANYGGISGGGIGFEGFGINPAYDAEYRGVGLPEHPKYGNTNVSSSAFKQDTKPRGLNMNTLYNASFITNVGGGILQGITQTIADTYNNYRKDKQLKINSRENLKDRYRAGIVFRGREDRDQLVRSNQMPAYYSTSNIKSLLRRGIMPFGGILRWLLNKDSVKKYLLRNRKRYPREDQKNFFKEKKIK